MFFDINGLVAAEKRLINVVNLEKKRDNFSCLAASRMGSVYSAYLCSCAISSSILSYFSSGRVRFTKVSRINLS